MNAYHRTLERLPLLEKRRAAAYAITLGFCAIAWWLRLVLDPFFPPGFPYLTFFPAVILASFLFGRGPGIVAALLCGLLAWYFFIPPLRSFGLGRGTAVALFFYVGVVTVDILLVHWMQVANARLATERERSAQLAARTEILFEELQHRVSNNLQMVGAMLSLQRRAVTDGEARRAIGDAAAKLQLIGRIQRRLYGSRGEPLALDAFVTALVEDLAESSGKPGICHLVEANSALLLPADRAIPLALIVAEAIANAVEHGFADRETGTVAVHVCADGDLLSLTIRDDGHGVPEAFDVAAVDSLGLRIARSLAQGMGAELRILPGRPGTLVELRNVPIDVATPHPRAD
jgi:two-component sensor histidine kinase